MESDFGLCGPCWAETPFIGGLACDLCGAPLPGGDPDEIAHCDDCLRTPRPWHRGRAVMLYEDLGRRLVLGLKHGDRLDIAAPAAFWMVDTAAPLLQDGMIVAPIPLHWRRRVSRGYNQSAEISRRLARRLQDRGALDLPDLLCRPRATPSLDGKSAADRFAALGDRLVVTPARRAALVGRPVLLIDDVMTSGATFSAATRACLDAGSGPVSVLALARAVKAP
ncbi:hypothetical protein PSAL_026950 [Pseudooceanicola algae]|uniref:Double zinc ribbon domain-containing protein n=1 Tax=Pseudooceanicola algae TaxID=1537215 RepID=A0A418SBE0_9RHOB|nr:hypothetical protein PSAL_026950 [Pseudooceanicola algae]